MVDFENDAVLPSQWRGGRADSAIERLMRAVLEEALRNLRLPLQSLVRVDAQEWFESRDRQWPFAFENICDYLRLDPDAVRARLPALVEGRFRIGPRWGNASPRTIRQHERRPTQCKGGLYAFRNRG